MALTDYITGIQHVGIPTDDLDETIKFYQLLGFKQVGLFKNGNNRCAFMKLGDLIIETWEGDQPARSSGAIDHISINTTDVESAFMDAQDQHLNLIDANIQSIPTFWKHGIKFFNIKGPNKEKIEFCQIL